MGVIYKRVEIAGDKGRKRVTALFDTGASASFVRRAVVDKIATIVKIPVPWTFRLGDGKAHLRTDRAVYVVLRFNRATFYHTLVVADDLADELILGADFMQRWKVKLDPEREEIIIDRRALRHLLI